MRLGSATAAAIRAVIGASRVRFAFSERLNGGRFGWPALSMVETNHATAVWGCVQMTARPLSERMAACSTGSTTVGFAGTNISMKTMSIRASWCGHVGITVYTICRVDLQGESL